MNAEKIANLARARKVLAELQAWQDVVAEAAQLRDVVLDFAHWPAAAEWYSHVPRYLPPREAEGWLRSQRVQASWAPKVGLIDPARQLEIAIESLNRRAPLPPVEAYLEPEPSGSYVVVNGRTHRVNSGRPIGLRLPEHVIERMRALHGKHKSANEIALELGVTSRTVTRYAAKWRAEQQEQAS